jgi:hypothetical protein
MKNTIQKKDSVNLRIGDWKRKVISKMGNGKEN